MKKKPLVSVIIPTYNRAHLIGETLDSVLVQTYQHWECIIVDDGSSDNTDEVVGEYVKKESRFKYYHRPEEYLSGGNGARNYGLDLAQGSYIVFFDSDDLMTEDHLQVKHDLITLGDYDFAITRTEYFNHINKSIDKNYNFTTEDITKENYILQKINWLTVDVIIKSKALEKLRFNEFVSTGQEYNYFSRLVYLTEKGIFKNKVVSLRRHHNNSKRSQLSTKYLRRKSEALKTWFTFYDTKSLLSESISKELLSRVYLFIIKNKRFPKEINAIKFWKAITIVYKDKSIIKFIYYFINKYTDRFHFLRKKALEQ